MLKRILLLEGELETDHCLPWVPAAPCSQSFGQQWMGCGLRSSSALFLAGTIPSAGEDLLLAPCWLGDAGGELLALLGLRGQAPCSGGGARLVPAPSRRQAGAGACCSTGQGEGAPLDQPCPARAIPISTVRGWGAVSPLGQPVAVWGGRALGQPHRCWAPTPRTCTGEKWSLPGKVELSSALPSSTDLAAADLGLQHPDAWPCSARERFLALDEAEVRAVSRADLQSASSSWRMGLTERGGSHQARAWAELKLKTLLLTLAGKETLQMLEE